MRRRTGLAILASTDPQRAWARAVYGCSYTPRRVIKHRWTEEPDSNIGIATCWSSGFVVVDVDCPEVEATLAEMEGLMVTAANHGVKAGSGEAAAIFNTRRAQRWIQSAVRERGSTSEQMQLRTFLARLPFVPTATYVF